MVNIALFGNGGLMEQILWWLGSFVDLALGMLFIERYKKLKVARKFIFGLIVFAFTYGTARILENIRKYIVSDDPYDIFHAWVAGTQITGLNLTLRILYYIISWCGIATFYFVSEKYVFRGKTYYLLTLSSIIEGAASIGNYIDGWTRYTIVVSTIGFFIAAIAPIVLYLNMARQNSGIIRTSCITVAIGLAMFVVGVMGDLPESMYVVYLVGGTPLPEVITSVVTPIVFMIGITVAYFGFRKMFSGLF